MQFQPCFRPHRQHDTAGHQHRGTSLDSTGPLTWTPAASSRLRPGPALGGQHPPAGLGGWLMSPTRRRGGGGSCCSDGEDGSGQREMLTSDGISFSNLLRKRRCTSTTAPCTSRRSRILSREFRAVSRAFSCDGDDTSWLSYTYI